MANLVLRIRITLIFSFFLSTIFAFAQEKQEKKESYTLGAGAVLTVTNDCGPVTLRPSLTKKVSVTTVWRSPAIRFVNKQRGKRLELRATAPSPCANLAEYTVLVPSADMVTVRSANGDLHVQGLHGDLALETSSSAITVSDMADAHLRARTLSGSIDLEEVHHSHVDIYSLNGDIHLHNVAGSWLEGHSTSGRITYDGDPGSEGEYKLFSHFGDLEVSIPSTAQVDVEARSLKSDQDAQGSAHIPAVGSKNSFLNSGSNNAVRFTLRSLRGNIRMTRP